MAYVIIIALGGWKLLPFLFGEEFTPFRALLWPIAVSQLLTSAGVGLVLLMKAERRGRDLLVNRALAATASLGFITFLAVRYGLLGAAWGTAVGSLTSLVLLTFATVARAPAARIQDPSDPPHDEPEEQNPA